MPNPTLDLFAAPEGSGEGYGTIRGGLIADLPRARETAPATSHEAAKGVKDSGTLARQQQLTLELVRKWPGLTASEYGEELAFAAHKRLPELLVFVVKGAPRKCSVTGVKATTWWPI